MDKIVSTYYATVQDMPGKEYKVEILQDGIIKKIAVNGKVYDVDYNVGGDMIHSIIINNRSHGVQISANSFNSYEVKNHGNSFQIQIMNELERIRSKFSEQEVMGRYLVAAPMPGVILKFYVKEGDVVKKNDPLCVLLAMKMENEIRAASDGKVSKIFVEEQAKVEIGEKLMVVDPVGK